jgi:uncharacterized protein YgiM (DUF1202 family)
MNKAEIIQRLLEQGHISVGEAVTLMTTQTQNVYYQIPTQYISPKMDPPWEVTCNTNEK